LLTAGNDQIVKVWELKTGRPLVSLFVAGSEWVAWTPQGYYAASLAGESLMGWHINQGPTRMADFYPASQFHKSLYRPDIIRRLLTTGDVDTSLQLADADRSTQSQKLAIADVLPPQVSILSPTGSHVDAHEAELTVEASAKPADQDPISALRLIVNGRPYGEPRATAAHQADPAAAVAEKWTVVLPPGKHEIIVKAETADSYGLSRLIEVTQTLADAKPQDGKPQDATTDTGVGESIAGAGAPAGKLFVLAIGAAPHATAANPSPDAKDARAIAAALDPARQTLFAGIVTHVLCDQQATATAIDAALEQMRSQMTLADTGVIYYAGQASVDAHGGYLLGGTHHPGPAETSGEISAAKLKSQLAAIRGRLVLMLDVTHSDERSDTTAGFYRNSQQRGGAGRVDAAANQWLRELLTEDYGVVVIGGSRRSGAIDSSSAAAQSALAQALIEALQGSADADRDGTVYLHELARYVVERVRSLSGGTQIPTAERPRGVRSFPLARPGVTSSGVQF
jgi:hypothetical protein